MVVSTIHTFHIPPPATLTISPDLSHKVLRCMHLHITTPHRIQFTPHTHSQYTQKLSAHYLAHSIIIYRTFFSLFDIQQHSPYTMTLSQTTGSTMTYTSHPYTSYPIRLSTTTLCAHATKFIATKNPPTYTLVQR